MSAARLHGCTAAGCIASQGHEVLGVDVSEGKVAAINSGRSPVLALGWLIWCAQASLRAPVHWRWTALGAGTGVLVLTMQSLLDYPLRNQTLLCLAALLVVLLARRRGQAA